jgi:fimbrial isopeptide formation D2 family protein/LPXTG-motif cell wall-anchored protein
MKKGKLGLLVMVVALIATMSLPFAAFADSSSESGGTVGFAGAPNSILDKDKDGKSSITIHKYLLGDKPASTADRTGTTADANNIPSDAKPLDGIKFTVTRVESAVPGSTDPKDYTPVAGPNDYKQTKETGQAPEPTGQATFNNLKFGYYLVKEEPSNAVTNPVEPFLVQVPTTLHNASGDDSLIYDVHVYPKNSAGLDIEKDGVAGGGKEEDGSKELPVNVGDTIDWYITAGIPDDIADPNVRYSIWDEYPVGLSYKANSVVVRAGTGLGTPPSFATTLLLGADYTVTLDPTVEAPGGGGKLKVALTDAGRAKVKGMKKISVKLSTIVLDTLEMGEGVENKGKIDYTDKSGADKEIVTDPGDGSGPEIFSGGYSFLKVDAADANKKLEGAKFKLVKRTSATSKFEDDFAAAKANTAETTTGYYQRPSALGTDLVGVSVAPTGYVEFTGIAYGPTKNDNALFWLVELDAPDGYRLPGEPQKIIIDKSSYDPKTSTSVTNAKGFEFPLTGGQGTLLFVVTGIVLIGIAGVVLASTRRNRRDVQR